jgi:hypothetical protein
VLDQGAKGGVLLLGIDDQARATQHHHGPVLERMVEGGSCQDDAVQQRDGDAHRHARPQAEPAAAGAVQVEGLAGARVPGRDHVRLAVHHEADVADEALVEDGVDGVAVVGGPLGQPPDPGPLGGLVHRRSVTVMFWNILGFIWNDNTPVRSRLVADCLGAAVR